MWSDGGAGTRILVTKWKGESGKHNSALLLMDVFSRVHATLQPALSVRPSVGRSVGRSHFTFIMILFL